MNAKFKLDLITEMNKQRQFYPYSVQKAKPMERVMILKMEVGKP